MLADLGGATDILVATMLPVLALTLHGAVRRSVTLAAPRHGTERARLVAARTGVPAFPLDFLAHPVCFPEVTRKKN
eukprot:m.383837 g.383837  ORF g.383837 m.383837 type:complete len:76 (+) comp16732_c0_seq7:2883-3110(+)